MAAPSSRRQFLRTVALAGAGLLLPKVVYAQESTPRRYLRCPILMYHYIGEVPPDASTLRRDLTVTAAQLTEQIAWLRDNGYTAITLTQLAAALLDGADLPAKPIVLTFDDGYADAYEVAAPILAQGGMVGTFFLISGRMDQPGYLSWAQAAELARAGMEIGNHSATHPDLTTLDRAAQQAEIEEAALAIEAAIGARPQAFCYPLGRYTLATVALLKETGHRVAVTTRDGTVQYGRYPYALRRVRIRNSTTLRTFAWLVDRQAW